MKSVKLQGYAAGSSEVYIAIDHIALWWGVSYNGQPGTEIELNNGREIRVRASSHDVQRAIEDAQA